MRETIIISNSNELYNIKPEQLVYVVSNGNYSTFMLRDRTQLMFSFNLSHSMQLLRAQLADNNDFVRLGRSLIINLNYVYHINPQEQLLWMTDGLKNRAFELKASADALKKLKDFMSNGFI